jgi:hypothetical protein
MKWRWGCVRVFVFQIWNVKQKDERKTESWYRIKEISKKKKDRKEEAKKNKSKKKKWSEEQKSRG